MQLYKTGDIFVGFFQLIMRNFSFTSNHLYVSSSGDAEKKYTVKVFIFFEEENVNVC